MNIQRDVFELVQHYEQLHLKLRSNPLILELLTTNVMVTYLEQTGEIVIFIKFLFGKLDLNLNVGDDRSNDVDDLRDEFNLFCEKVRVAIQRHNSATLSAELFCYGIVFTTHSSITRCPMFTFSGRVPIYQFPSLTIVGALPNWLTWG